MSTSMALYFIITINNRTIGPIGGDRCTATVNCTVSDEIHKDSGLWRPAFRM